MNSPLKIGIIGDFDPKRPSHIATNEALEHTAVELSVKVGPIWVPTHELAEEGSEITLKQFDALWCGPGSPYHMKGVLRAIHFAREQDRPFIGTWGGFQHTLVEYARNVLDIENAEHEEVTPGALNPIISKLSCSIAGTTQRVKIIRGTQAYQIYQTDDVTEVFNCNYGLNSKYRDKITQGEIIVSGMDSNGEVRIFELGDHRFFVATLFLPQASSHIGKSHPLIKAYLKAAMDFHDKMI